MFKSTRIRKFVAALAFSVGLTGLTACAGPSFTGMTLTVKPGTAEPAEQNIAAKKLQGFLLDSGVDIGGGPRVKIVGLLNERGELVTQAAGAGEGTLQDATKAALQALGIVGGSLAFRPSAAQTIVKAGASAVGLGEGGDATANGAGSSQVSNVAVGQGGNGGTGFGGSSYSGATSFGGNSGLSAQFNK